MLSATSPMGILATRRQSSLKATGLQMQQISKDGNDEEKLDYKTAPCCNPIAGDKVFGFVTINDGIKIHKKTCPNAVSLQSNYDYRIIKAKWIDSSQEGFTVNIEITGIDTIGLLNEITKVISENMNINMKRLNF